MKKKLTMDIVHIAEPYWGAWSKYGWERPIPGIGLSEKVIKSHAITKEPIRVTIGKDPTIYQISIVTALNLAKKYKSIRTVRYGVKVAIVPQNKFLRVTPVNKERFEVFDYA